MASICFQVAHYYFLTLEQSMKMVQSCSFLFQL